MRHCMQQNNNDFLKDKKTLRKSKNLTLSIYYISLIAIFSALVYVFTAFAAFPIGTGYVHLGDIFIFESCMFLGFYAVIPAVLGSILADIFLGFGYYVPATAIIKGLMVVILLLIKGKKKSGARVLLSMIISSVFMQIGYTSYELLLILIGSSNALTYAVVLSPILILSNFSQTLFGVLGGYIMLKISNRLNLFDRKKIIMSIEKEKHE